MRRIKLNRLLLAVLFAAMLGVVALAFPVVPHAGTLADPALLYASPTVALSFDDAYTADAVLLAQVDIEVLSPSGVVVATWEITTFTAADGVVKVPINAQVGTLANGVYQLQARVVDVYGNASGWSDALYVSKQWRPVTRPGGCRTLP